MTGDGKGWALATPTPHNHPWSEGGRDRERCTPHQAACPTATAAFLSLKRMADERPLLLAASRGGRGRGVLGGGFQSAMGA